MDVFISYSTADTEDVQKIANRIRPIATPKYWDESKTPGQPVWSSIHKWIDASSCVVVLITDNVVSRGESVHQEIGYAKAKGKSIIPLVASSVDKSRLGCLHDLTYVTWDGANPNDAIRALLSSFKQIKKSQFIGLVLVLGIIVAMHFWPDDADPDEATAS